MGTSGSGSLTGDGTTVGTSSGGGGMFETAVRVGCSFTNGGGGTVKADRRIGRMGTTGGVSGGIFAMAGGLILRLDDFDDRLTGDRERDRDVEEATDVEAGDVDELDDVVSFRRRRRRTDASEDDDDGDELV